VGRSALVEAYEARVAGGGLALIDGARNVTWDALDALARGHAARLAALGVGPGERVAVMLPTSVELIAVTLAHLRLGVVHVPINTRYQPDEVDYIVTHAEVRVLISDWQESEPMVRWSDEPAADDVAMIIYTSGTTGRPKGVMQTHASLAANIGAVMRLWRVSSSDVLSLALPLFHVHGLGLGVIGALLLSGARVRLHAKFEVRAIVADFVTSADPATLFMGVPTMYHGLLAHLDAHPDDGRALAGARLFTAGSAALAAHAFERFREATGHAILERYGMTETGFTLSNPYDGERRAGTVGKAVPGVDVRVADGEIQVRGASLSRGYWRDPEATAASFTADGWFKTGDVAEVDDDGYHRIVGRASTDIIKSGGFKIGAREIEDVLAKDERLVEVAVIGVPDDKWGEIVAAVVVAKPGVALPETLLAELQALAGEHLADFKRPRAVCVIDALPRNAMGKVQKPPLRALFTAPR